MKQALLLATMLVIALVSYGQLKTQLTRKSLSRQLQPNRSRHPSMIRMTLRVGLIRWTL